MSDSEKTLGQMLIELREPALNKQVQLHSGFGSDWTLRISYIEQDGPRSNTSSKTYTASTPMGAVVQAYRDR